MRNCVFLLLVVKILSLVKFFNACIWAPRILGPLSNTYGILTAFYGVINHPDPKAREARGEKYQAINVQLIFTNFMYACLQQDKSLGYYTECLSILLQC